MYYVFVRTWPQPYQFELIKGLLDRTVRIDRETKEEMDLMIPKSLLNRTLRLLTSLRVDSELQKRYLYVWRGYTLDNGIWEEQIRKDYDHKKDR
jgi:hypothetical protein